MSTSTAQFREPASSSPVDELSLLEVVNATLRKWRLVVLLPVIAALLVGVYAFTRPRSYVARASFIPVNTQGTSVTSGLARQLGVNLPSERPGQSPEFYVGLLNSRAVLLPVVRSEYEVRGEQGSVVRRDLVELFEVGGGPISEVDLAIDQLQGRISASVDRQTGMVSFSVTALEPRLAEQIAARLLEVLNEFNINYSQRRAKEEGRFILSRAEDAREPLLEAEEDLQRFLQQNRNFENSPELRFEYERLARRVTIYQDVYTTLLRSYEQNRIDAVRDTPLLTIIDSPEGAARPVSRGTVLKAVLAFLLTITLIILWNFGSELARSQARTGTPAVEEFRRLVASAWRDVRHPSRWIRPRA